MKDLVTLIEGKPVVSSKAIADAFSKTHRNVLVDIRKLISDTGSFGEHNFLLSEYTSLQNKKLPCYMMTRDGFALLAMGFTGTKALEWKVKYIQAFNAMERALIERTSLMQQLDKEFMAMEKDRAIASGAGRALRFWRDAKQDYDLNICKIKSKLQLLLPFDDLPEE